MFVYFYFVCPCCNKKSTSVSRRRLNTAYTNEEQNWLISCRSCFECQYEYYLELWGQIH